MKPTLENLYDRCEPFATCMLWTQGTIKGHPQARIDGKPGMLVRRYVFTELLGNELLGTNVVGAKCGERLCICAECLIQVTRGSILRKCYADGTRSTAGGYLSRVRQRQAIGTTKLDFNTAREVRQSTETNTALAARFGCHTKTISHARRGLTWRESMPGSSVFNQRIASCQPSK